MRDVTSAGQGPSRRLAMAGALGAGVALLAGCGIRLEDDAPRVPLVPARSPIDGEDALVRLLAALQSGALAPVDPAVPVSALLPALHARQATVLHDALRKRGVPADELPSATASPSATGTPQASPTTSPTASPSTSPSASPTVPVTKVTVAVTENAILTAGGAVAAAEADLRPMLLATLAQAHAALDLAGAGPASTAGPTAMSATPTPTPTSTPTPTTTPTWARPQVVAPLVTAARTATYFLQVAAARSPKAIRSAWLVDLDGLHSLTAEMVEAAGTSAPDPVLGLPLPHPVTTPAEATTLATEALSTLLTSFGAQLPTLCEGDADAAAAFSVVPRWLGTVAAQAHRHGVPLAPFPGLA